MKRNNIKRCRTLRKNQTDAERKLWPILRRRQLQGVKFRRQFSVDKYILDFYAPEYNLGIEADGSQHYEKEGLKREKIREKILTRCGIKILRFSDLDILNNIDGVCEVIGNVVEGLNKVPCPNNYLIRGRPGLVPRAPLPLGEGRVPQTISSPLRGEEG